MLLLCQSITPAPEASPQAAWGLLPATAPMHSRLQGLGLQALALPTAPAQGAQGLDNAHGAPATNAEAEAEAEANANAKAAADTAQPTALRGHTFHYASISTTLPALAHTTSARASRRQAGEALYQSGPQGNVWASHFHPWFASSPQAAAQLFLPRPLAATDTHPATPKQKAPPCSPTTN